MLSIDEYIRCISSTRTQVYVTDEERERIDGVAAIEGVAMVQVIRRAADEYLDGGPDPEAALAATFGAVPDAGRPVTRGPVADLIIDTEISSITFVASTSAVQGSTACTTCS